MSSRLWALVQGYLDSQGGMSARALARKVGVAAQTLDQWKGSRPKPEYLRKLARAIDLPYEVVLAAVMADEGYRTDDELVEILRGARISDTDREILLRHITAHPGENAND